MVLCLNWLDTKADCPETYDGLHCQSFRGEVGRYDVWRSTMSESDSPVSGRSDSGRPVPSFETWSWEPFEYLARSPKRIRVLHALEEGSCRKADLVDGLNISRSTLLRTLKEMTEYVWVTEVQNGLYDTTPTGKKTAALVEEFYGQFHTLTGLTQLDQVLLSELTDCTEFRSLLQAGVVHTGITIYVSTPDAPYEPMQQFAKGLRSAEIDCLFLGVPNPFYTEPIRDLLKEESVSKLTISRNIVSAIVEREQLTNIHARGSVSLSITEDSFRYGGYLTDRELVIEGIDEADSMTQIVVELPFRSDIVEEWADHILSTLKTDADSNSILRDEV